MDLKQHLSAKIGALLGAIDKFKNTDKCDKLLEIIEKELQLMLNLINTYDN